MATTLALVGNPNVGKTAVFNALTGLSQTTGNYAGVTVSRTYGTLHLGEIKVKLADLPGSYSLAARSPDEVIVVDVLLDQQTDEAPITGIIVVMDASNLERNLYFLSQLIELKKPFIVALNMMDIADRRGIKINCEALSKALGAPVVPVRAHKQQGFSTLCKAILALYQGDLKVSSSVGCTFPESQIQAVAGLAALLKSCEDKLGRTVPLPEVGRILIDAGGYAEKRIVRRLGPDFVKTLAEYREAAVENGASLPAQEAKVRYGWVKEILAASVTQPDPRKHSRPARIDNGLTTKLYGPV
ncbi:MAG: 50S ribosome-binding GTPase, partial [Candidatus Hydrogenedentes bacterium]|nr:50S ribosome-binding GTPase [Candidatus Hydrogenedentota bacterium]